MDLEKLGQEIPYKWKVQACNEWGCTCVAYIDARDVMEILDNVVGPGKWQNRYQDVKSRAYCGIGIKCGDEWIWKWDCGAESDIEQEKGEASDAFKRAGVHWKIGRFLYNLEAIKIKKVIKDGKNQKGKDRYAPADDKGKKIWNVDKYIKTVLQAAGKKPAQKQPAQKQPPSGTGRLPDQMRKNIFAIFTDALKILAGYDPKDCSDVIHYYFDVKSVNDITEKRAAEFIKNHTAAHIKNIYGKFDAERMERAETHS